MKENVHVGHRQRLRNRAVENNLEGFEEHQILELLLTYVIPQKDTNPLAHDLINEFGSLGGVLNASPKELMQVKGISEYSSSFLSILKDVFRKYKQSITKNILKICNCREAIQYFNQELSDLPDEKLLVVCLDNENNIINKKTLSMGVSNQTIVPIRKIVDIIVKNNCSNVMIGHNHPNGNSKPSVEDDITTKNLVYTLSLSGIKLLDHIIIGQDNSYSYFQTGRIGEYISQVEINTKSMMFGQEYCKYEK